MEEEVSFAFYGGAQFVFGSSSAHLARRGRKEEEGTLAISARGFPQEKGTG